MDKLAWMIMFPYHYGSHATAVAEEKILRYFRFPYHYGSHATMKVEDNKARKRQFPYHYGSHATVMSMMSRYRGGCFHTTMVLTQPLLLQNNYI